MTIMRVVGSVAVAVGLLLGSAPRALAHGRFPEAGYITFHPSDPNTIVVRTSFGLLVSHDAGASFRWICQQSMNQRITEDPNVLVAADNTLLVPLFAGYMRGEDNGCSFRYVDALTGRIMIDQVRDPLVATSIWSVSSNFDSANYVYFSDDEGRSWEARPGDLGEAILDRIRVAPTDALRVYLSGSTLDETGTLREGTFLRSRDGGESFETLPFSFEAGERSLLLLAVDPTNADKIFARVSGDFQDRLVMTVDAGDHWTDLAALPFVQSFVIAPDGQRLWFGGGQDSGLWYSSDGGETLEQLDRDLDVNCLGLRDDELWICANNATDGFAIGKSTDGGRVFTPVFRFAEFAGIVECEGESETVNTCEMFEADIRWDLGADGGVPFGTDAGFRDAGVVVGDAGSDVRDAGMVLRKKKPSGCSAAQGRSPDAGIGLVALGFAAFARCKRRRAPL